MINDIVRFASPNKGTDAHGFVLPPSQSSKENVSLMRVKHLALINYNQHMFSLDVGLSRVYLSWKI